MENEYTFIIITAIVITLVCFVIPGIWGTLASRKKRENEKKQIKKRWNQYRCNKDRIWIKEQEPIEKILENPKLVNCILCVAPIGYTSSFSNYAGVDIICYECKEKIETKWCK